MGDLLCPVRVLYKKFSLRGSGQSCHYKIKIRSEKKVVNGEDIDM